MACSSNAAMSDAFLATNLAGVCHWPCFSTKPRGTIGIVETRVVAAIRAVHAAIGDLPYTCPPAQRSTMEQPTRTEHSVRLGGVMMTTPGSLQNRSGRCHAATAWYASTMK